MLFCRPNCRPNCRPSVIFYHFCKIIYLNNHVFCIIYSKPFKHLCLRCFRFKSYYLPIQQKKRIKKTAKPLFFTFLQPQIKPIYTICLLCLFKIQPQSNQNPTNGHFNFWAFFVSILLHPIF